MKDPRNEREFAIRSPIGDGPETIPTDWTPTDWRELENREQGDFIDRWKARHAVTNRHMRQHAWVEENPLPLGFACALVAVVVAIGAVVLLQITGTLFQ